jgi:hypothetical protein
MSGVFTCLWCARQTRVRCAAQVGVAGYRRLLACGKLSVINPGRDDVDIILL